MRSERELLITAVNWTLNARLHDCPTTCSEMPGREERNRFWSGVKDRGAMKGGPGSGRGGVEDVSRADDRYFLLVSNTGEATVE